MSPQFSEKALKQVEKIVARYPHKEAALLPVLVLARREFGRIAEEEEKLVAAILGIKPIKVREVVTFYSMLNREKIGKYHIQVCSNISCTVMGAETLLDHIRKKIGIEPGQTTEDGKFSLSTVECLGACEMAPCMMVNEHYYGNLDKKKIDKILDKME
ncbi:MAG: NADH-quinone oxidoreductase subunit NuoE [Candidatus Aminicenantes bacterium]|nr:NADH-quinone oxidoreductase subunit NuoE [Candidatus Aminicenantes bacterium]